MTEAVTATETTEYKYNSEELAAILKACDIILDIAGTDKNLTAKQVWEKVGRIVKNDCKFCEADEVVWE